MDGGDNFGFGERDGAWIGGAANETCEQNVAVWGAVGEERGVPDGA